MRSYIFNILLALDNLLNAILLGNPNEPISARLYREKHYKLMAIVDHIFWWEPNHCEATFNWIKSRRNLPSEYYQCD